MAPRMLTKKGVFGVVAGHQNRHLVIDPKSGALYVGVGSVGNIGVEPEPKATIQRFDPDGSNQSTVVWGTRNPTALAFTPTLANSGRWCRSATASATICHQII
jgi:glucose/arabinose dehydrogenase